VNYTAASNLANQIKSMRPDLNPVARMIGDGREAVVRFETVQRKRTVGWYIIWDRQSWIDFLESHQSKHREAS
jgi:hypothetical protein